LATNKNKTKVLNINNHPSKWGLEEAKGTTL
jgi:hypothetical protein